MCGWYDVPFDTQRREMFRMYAGHSLFQHAVVTSRPARVAILLTHPTPAAVNALAAPTPARWYVLEQLVRTYVRTYSRRVLGAQEEMRGAALTEPESDQGAKEERDVGKVDACV